MEAAYSDFLGQAFTKNYLCAFEIFPENSTFPFIRFYSTIFLILLFFLCYLSTIEAVFYYSYHRKNTEACK